MALLCVPGKSGGVVVTTYTINFLADESSTTWAFISKHFDNIVSVETTNVDSYTINGISITLPLEVILNTSYLINIVKTVSTEVASIVFTVTIIDFAENSTAVDFSIGDGRWTYLLGNNTDVATNRTLLKYDNDLLTVANYSGAGGFTINPLAATITLPMLPANGWWSKTLWILGDYMLVSAGNTANLEKYFCKINVTTNEVTDFNGNIDSYSLFTGAYNGYPITQIYNYVDNLVYFSSTYTLFAIINNITTLNLTDFTISTAKQWLGSNGWNSNKVFFDPYQKTFQLGYHTFNAENRPVYKYIASYGVTHNVFNRKTNLKYIPQDNDSRRLCVLNHKGEYQYTLGWSGNKTGIVNYTLDSENNELCTFTRPGYSSSQFFYKLGIPEIYAFSIIDLAVGDTTYFLDFMHTKSHNHIALSGLKTRLHLFDLSLLPNTPEFGYIDLPILCWNLYANKIL